MQPWGSALARIGSAGPGLRALLLGALLAAARGAYAADVG